MHPPKFESWLHPPIESGGITLYVPSAISASDKYLAFPVGNTLATYDLKEKTWRLLGSGDGTMTISHVCIDDENILAFYNIRRGGDIFEGGFIKFDIPDGKTTLLASSRRKPALSRLDDVKPYRCKRIFKIDNEKFMVDLVGLSEKNIENFIIDHKKIMPLFDESSEFFGRYIQQKISFPNRSLRYADFLSISGEHYLLSLITVSQYPRNLASAFQCKPTKELRLFDDKAYCTLAPPVLYHSDFILTKEWVGLDLKTGYGVFIPHSFNILEAKQKELGLKSFFPKNICDRLCANENFYLLFEHAVARISIVEVKELFAGLSEKSVAEPHNEVP